MIQKLIKDLYRNGFCEFDSHDNLMYFHQDEGKQITEDDLNRATEIAEKHGLSVNVYGHTDLTMTIEINQET